MDKRVADAQRHEVSPAGKAEWERLWALVRAAEALDADPGSTDEERAAAYRRWHRQREAVMRTHAVARGKIGGD